MPPVIGAARVTRNKAVGLWPGLSKQPRPHFFARIPLYNVYR